MDKLYKKKAISCKKEKQTSENKIKIAKTKLIIFVFCLLIEAKKLIVK